MQRSLDRRVVHIYVAMRRSRIYINQTMTRGGGYYLG